MYTKSKFFFVQPTLFPCELETFIIETVEQCDKYNELNSMKIAIEQE